MKFSEDTFPKDAPYSRDKLKFAHNYIDAIVEWHKNHVKEEQEIFQSIFDVWDKLPDKQLKMFVNNRFEEILGK